MYHFLLEYKPNGRIDLLITASMNIYQKKKRKKNSNSNENMLFWRKTDKTIWKAPFLREPLLSTNPPISENCFHNLPLCSNFKNRKKPPPSLRGQENYINCGSWGTPQIMVPMKQRTKINETKNGCLGDKILTVLSEKPIYFILSDKILQSKVSKAFEDQSKSSYWYIFQS